MLKSKSFRINHEVDKKPSVQELLYDTKRVRWMKFLVIPLLIAFSLLLVLSNVNFSGESYELVVAPSGESRTIATKTPTKEVNAFVSINYDTPTEEVELHSIVGDGGEKKDHVAEKESDNKEKKASDAMNVAVQYSDKTLAIPAPRTFTCDDHNSCKTVICTGGPIYNILNELEYFINWCGNIFYDVIIEDCIFNESTIGNYTLAGNFKMSTLTIRNCQLDTIVDNAFKYQSVSKLTNLTFVGVQLKALNAQTFNGLESVKNFQLYNILTQTTSPLKANHFLQPMAASLSNLVLQQTEESHSAKTIYDPTAWLGGNSDTVYSKLLYVDLSGTKFNDTLNGNTFAKLSAVHELRLANCNLSTIAENVFTDILPTLKSLDLRYNQLQTLDGGFLATALVKGVNIEFGLNLWNCDCDNVEIIEYMKQVENSAATETVCATPMELQGIHIGDAQMRCDDKTTVSTIITTISTTTAAATTNIATTSTAEITVETTDSNSKPQPIPSTVSIDNSTLPPTTSDTTAVTISTNVTTEFVSMDPTMPASSTTALYKSTLPTSVTTNNITNAVTTLSSATTEGTDLSESTDLTPTTTTKPTPAPTTTLNTSTIASTTTIETVAPTSSPNEDDTTMETTESLATTTPPLTSTTLIIFPGTTIIPMPTIKTTETTTTTTTTTSQGTNTTEIEHTTGNKINITTTTAPATIAPTSPPLTTCFNNSSPKFLVCTDIIAIRLCDYDATFNVVTISARSVQLQIGKNANSLQAIYFQALNNNSVCEEIDVGNKSRIDIDNLASNGSYTFCLIPKQQTSTSPFNCRSAHLPLETAQPWLEHSDVVLFCTITILITVVCLIVGVTLIYYLLRWRPTLLYGNKRLRRIASASHEVLLFPKPDRTSVDSKTQALNELSKMHASVSDTLTPENYLNIKSYDYMQYFKNAELEKQRRVAHISLNQPPVHRAPALPPNVGGAATRRNDRLNYFGGYLPVRALSQQSSVVLEDAPQPTSGTRRGAAAWLPPEPVEVLENEYESLDYYQELY